MKMDFIVYCNYLISDRTSLLPYSIHWKQDTRSTPLTMGGNCNKEVKSMGSLGASRRSRASYFILGQLVEDNNHIFRPLKPLYSNISTFISSLVGSFHSFNRNADRIAFRWLLSRNALLERSLYYSSLLATPSYIKTVSNFLSCLFFFLVKLFFRPFTNLELIIFLFGNCEITHLRWFF